jgi:hypothetical protein
MWVVADVNDDYIAKMEDVLEVYKQPYDPQQPVICVDESRSTGNSTAKPPVVSSDTKPLCRLTFHIDPRSTHLEATLSGERNRGPGRDRSNFRRPLWRFHPPASIDWGAGVRGESADSKGAHSVGSNDRWLRGPQRACAPL